MISDPIIPGKNVTVCVPRIRNVRLVMIWEEISKRTYAEIQIWQLSGKTWKGAKVRGWSWKGAYKFGFAVKFFLETRGIVQQFSEAGRILASAEKAMLAELKNVR